MHELQQLRKRLADRLHDISSLPAADGQAAQQHAAHKQALIQAEVNKLHSQLLCAAQVRWACSPASAALIIVWLMFRHACIVHSPSGLNHQVCDRTGLGLLNSMGWALEHRHLRDVLLLSPVCCCRCVGYVPPQWVEQPYVEQRKPVFAKHKTT
jgi:hypothetical protein